MRALICASLAASLAACTGITQRIRLWPQRATPIVDASLRIELRGFSVLPPPGPGWAMLPPVPSQAGEANLVVSFGNLNRPALHSVAASVRLIDAREQTFDSPRALEALSEAQLGKAPAETLQKVLALHVEPADSAGRICVRYELQLQDNAVPADFEKRFLVGSQGYRCVDPKWPRYIVDLRFSQRYPDSEKPYELEAQAAPFLQSLAFTDERPIFVANIPVGPGPQQLVAAAGSIWVAYGAHGVARIDPKTNQVIAQIVAGKDPVGIAFAAGSIWCANREDGTLSRIDPAANSVVATVLVGGAPMGLAAGAGSLWVSDQVAGDVIRVDPERGRVLARIHLGGAPGALIASETAVYAGLYTGDRLARIDPRTNQPDSSILVPRAPGIIGEGLGSIWIAGQGEGEVARVDPLSGRITAVIPVHARPSAIAAADGKIWISGYNESTVFAIDPKTNREVGRRISVCAAPNLMIESGGALWVSGAMSNSVCRVDY